MSTYKPTRSARLRARRLFALAAAVSACAVSMPSRASTTYPEAVADALEMPCAPPCTVCHRDNNGGIRTVVQPFGLAMMDAGLKFFAPETVPAVLDVLAEAATDSDGDGATDVDELRAGQDPNGELDLCGRAAQFGCFNSIVARHSDFRTRDLMSAILFGLGIGVWIRRKESAGRKHAE